MTYEEAKKDIIDYMNHKFERLPTCTLWMCSDALEKQIPRKPEEGITYSANNPNKKIYTLDCPNCTADLTAKIKEGETIWFCPECGQRLEKTEI